jgi:glutamate 5-kinase
MCLPFQVVLIAKVQALAAIGQGRLIALWDNLFSLLGQPIAQVLLTRSDISDVHLVIRDDMTPSLTR